MLHTWDSGNFFFERPTDDSTEDTAAPDRPPKGYAVKVRDAEDLTALPDLATDPGGHWTYSAEKDAPKMGIQFSADSGSTWTAVLWSQESFGNSMEAGANAADALTAAQTANDRVDNLADQIENSVAGVAKVTTPTHPDGLTGDVVLTAAEVGARPASTKVPVDDIQGLALPAKTNSVTDFPDYVKGIPLSQMGSPNGVPVLDANGKIKPGYMPNGFGTVGDVAGVTPDGEGSVDGAALITALDVPTNDDLADYAKTSDLETVATTGKYSDLIGKPGKYELLCDPTTGTWDTRSTETGPKLWNSIARSKAQGEDVVPPTGTGGAVDGDHRVTWVAD